MSTCFPREKHFFFICLIDFFLLPTVLPAKTDFRNAFARGLLFVRHPWPIEKNIITVKLFIKCFVSGLQISNLGLELGDKINCNWKFIMEDFYVFSKIELWKLQKRTKKSGVHFSKMIVYYPLPRKLIRMQSKYFSSCWSLFLPCGSVSYKSNLKFKVMLTGQLFS